MAIRRVADATGDPEFDLLQSGYVFVSIKIEVDRRATTKHMHMQMVKTKSATEISNANQRHGALQLMPEENVKKTREFALGKLLAKEGAHRGGESLTWEEKEKSAPDSGGKAVWAFS